MFKALLNIFSKKQSEVAEAPVKEEVKSQPKTVIAKTTKAKPPVKKAKTKGNGTTKK